MITVIYSLNTGAIRRWVVPDHNEDPHLPEIVKGEGRILLTVDEYNSCIGFEPLQDLVSKKTGLSPYDKDGNRIDRYILVDPQTKQIVTTTHLDPLIDSVPFDVVKNNEAEPNWTFDVATQDYVRPVQVVTPEQQANVDLKAQARLEIL